MGKIYGYVRVSTRHQSLERQIQNIKEQYPQAVVWEDCYTGTRLDRPGWNKLMRMVRCGDTIVFDSVSRMSRNAEEGFAEYKKLFDRGIHLEFLKEPMVNTAVYQKQIEEAEKKTKNNPVSSGSPALDTFTSGLMELIRTLFMDMAAEQIRISFLQSEKEVCDLHTRISEGVQLAIAGGKKVGGLSTKGTRLITQKSIEAKSLILKHSRAFGGTLKDQECMLLCGISRNSYYKYKRELKEQQPVFQ